MMTVTVAETSWRVDDSFHPVDFQWVERGREMGMICI